MEDDTLLRHLGVPHPPPTRPQTATIDCSAAASEQDVHVAFAEVLSFPVHYGRNWDAFWDVLTGHGCFPPAITICGRAHLLTHVPSAVGHLERCFTDLRQQAPDDAVVVTWT
jgi:RNAse (barnase) inhibitor barstar